MTATDLRMQKTIQKIQRALVTLMEQRHYEQITVGDIMHEAKISRGAFYHNFDNKAACFAFFRDKLLHHAVDLIEIIVVGYRRPFFKAIFAYLQGDGKLLALMLSTHGTAQLQSEIKGRVQHYVDEFVIGQFTNSPKTPTERHYLTVFCSNAILGVFQAWIDGGEQESPETMMNVMDSILLNLLDHKI